MSAQLGYTASFTLIHIKTNQKQTHYKN